MADLHFELVTPERLVRADEVVLCTTGDGTTTLTGPEGGISEEERTAIRAEPGATAISLGPRILRAETAALATITAYMALAGDWR